MGASSGLPQCPIAEEAGGLPRLGVSRCLLGEAVRYDGGHKHDRFLTDVLGPHGLFSNVAMSVEKEYKNKIWLLITLAQQPRISDIHYHALFARAA